MFVYKFPMKITNTLTVKCKLVCQEAFPYFVFHFKYTVHGGIIIFEIIHLDFEICFRQ